MVADRCQGKKEGEQNEINFRSIAVRAHMTKMKPGSGRKLDGCSEAACRNAVKNSEINQGLDFTKA